MNAPQILFSIEAPHRSWLYRTEPPVQALRGAGQRCRVGIPPTVLHVLYIDILDVPHDTGMLPPPSGWLVTLPTGVSFDPTEPVGLLVELIAAWEPDGPTPGVEVAEPIRIELVSRPYAFLADGDIVTDSGGRRWRFEVPLRWQALDGQSGPGPRGTGAPDWPLRLASEDGEPDPARRPPRRWSSSYTTSRDVALFLVGFRVMNRNAQRAHGALRKVVEDVGVSTFTATAWPGWATVCCQATSRCHSAAVGRLPRECGEERDGTRRGRTHR